jgi:uncharacterized protein YdeI (YjbR/CyaY-like superfamily)
MQQKKDNVGVEVYFNKLKKWGPELTELRAIVQSTKLLKEELKWHQPCFTLNDGNVLILSSFKEYCIIGFFKGALLKDAKGLLVQAGQNTQAGRQMRFTSLSEITKLKSTIVAYIKEAVAIEKSGLKVEMKTTKDYAVPEELKKAFKQDATFKKAFESLTPGRQRGYLLFIGSAKQATTREARIEKHYDRILAGKGLDD